MAKCHHARHGRIRKGLGMDQTGSSSAPRREGEGSEVSVTLHAETRALQVFLGGLKSDLAEASQQVRELALDLLDLAPEFLNIQGGGASRAGMTILLEPSQWLRDFSAAVRAGDLDWLGVQQAHRRPPI